MSYALRVYQVDLNALRATVGSNDTALLQRVLAREAYAIRAHDEWFADEIAGGDPTLGQALEQIVRNQMVRSAGYAYGYALELLCRELGEPLPSDNFQGIGWSWIETVDARLAELNAPPRFRLDRLAGIFPLQDVPRPSDFPSIGHLTPEDLDAARAWAAALEPADGTTRAVEEILDWLEAPPGMGLVGFYS